MTLYELSQYDLTSSGSWPRITLVQTQLDMTSDKTQIIWTRNLYVTLTIEELADMIICLDSEQQAILISTMAQLTESFVVNNQLQYISDSSALTKEGRNLMRLIGDYS